MITIKDTRCAGIDCKQRKDCLRHIDLKMADNGAPVAERVCEKGIDKMIKQINQCDGCARGLPIVNGIHRGEGYDLIACTKHRYIDKKEVKDDQNHNKMIRRKYDDRRILKQME